MGDSSNDSIGAVVLRVCEELSEAKVEIIKSSTRNLSPSIEPESIFLTGYDRQYLWCIPYMYSSSVYLQQVSSIDIIR